MKSSILFAAGSLLGSAMAGVHRAPLKKVPLTEQLVSLQQFNLFSYFFCFGVPQLTATLGLVVLP